MVTFVFPNVYTSQDSMVLAQRVEMGSESREVEDIMIIYEPPPQSHHDGDIAYDGILYPISEGNLVPTGGLMICQEVPIVWI